MKNMILKIMRLEKSERDEFSVHFLTFFSTAHFLCPQHPSCHLAYLVVKAYSLNVWLRWWLTRRILFSKSSSILRYQIKIIEKIFLITPSIYLLCFICSLPLSPIIFHLSCWHHPHHPLYLKIPRESIHSQRFFATSLDLKIELQNLEYS